MQKAFPFHDVITLTILFHDLTQFQSRSCCPQGDILIMSTTKPYLLTLNSLWPSDCDAIWWQRSVSTLAQVMPWCLTAPSHYLSQCWSIYHGEELNICFMTWPSFKRCPVALRELSPHEHNKAVLVWSTHGTASGISLHAATHFTNLSAHNTPTFLYIRTSTAFTC